MPPPIGLPSRSVRAWTGFDGTPGWPGAFARRPWDTVRPVVGAYLIPRLGMRVTELVAGSYRADRSCTDPEEVEESYHQLGTSRANPPSASCLPCVVDQFTA